jgi:hypothetical protein
MISTQISTSACEHWSLRLPKEHVAIVVFSLACVISLLLCRTEPIIITCCQLVLWAMVLSLHHQRQLLLLAMLGMLALHALYGVPLAAWIAVVWAGVQATRDFSTRFWWREALGLSGAALAPLMVSCILSGDYALHLIAGSALLAATLTGSALTRVSRTDTRVSSIPAALLSLFLWVYLAVTSPITAAIALVPYVAQSVWLIKVSKPSIKQLGRMQSACLFWVATTIALRIFGLI